MRIISGSARGLKLLSPEGIDTRPTLDRVKEALFSMLLPYMNSAVILDLFAGSGALGIESLSRGAEKCFFIDSSDKAVECIKKNIVAAKFSECSEILRTDAITFLNNTKEKFDIIFLDPPYAKGLYEDVLELISKKDILSDGGLVVVEWDYSNGNPVNDNISLEVLKEKKYGRVGITVLKRR